MQASVSSCDTCLVEIDGELVRACSNRDTAEQSACTVCDHNNGALLTAPGHLSDGTSDEFGPGWKSGSGGSRFPPFFEIENSFNTFIFRYVSPFRGLRRGPVFGAACYAQIEDRKRGAIRLDCGPNGN